MPQKIMKLFRRRSTANSLSPRRKKFSKSAVCPFVCLGFDDCSTISNESSKSKDDCDCTLSTDLTKEQQDWSKFMSMKLQLDTIEKIKQRNWTYLTDLSTCELKTLSEGLRHWGLFDGSSILQMILRHDPTLEIVAKIVEDMPETLTQADSFGRTPLHLCIEYGVSEDIVSYILEKNPKACGVKDQDGNTPLHRCFDGSLDRDLTKDAIQSIIAASGPSITTKNNFGASALELAILSEAPLEIVNELQLKSSSRPRRQ